MRFLEVSNVLKVPCFDIQVSWNHMENILELGIKMVVVVNIMMGVGVVVVVVVLTNDMKISVEVISTWT